MPVVTNKSDSMYLSNLYKAKGIPVCVFGSSSYWNTEAVLLAGKKLKEKHSPSSPVVLVIAVTYLYKHMAQCGRFTYSQNPQLGMMTFMHFLGDLCDGPHAPYGDIYILPHLDHADPIMDKWALTEGREYFSSVMFDAQSYQFDENLKMTADYVRTYGNETVIEGIMDELTVSVSMAARKNAPETTDLEYAKKAQSYIAATGVDFIVADLGTEQQSTEAVSTGYLRDRARALANVIGDTGVVLHGASSMPRAQLAAIGSDGISRLNIWTRIVRESCAHAADRLENRRQKVGIGDFEATDSKAYLYDCVEKASEIMLDTMELVGYTRL